MPRVTIPANRASIPAVSFDIPEPDLKPVMVPLAALDARVAAQDAKLDAILAAVKAIGGGVVVPPPPPNPTVWPPLVPPAPGSVIQLERGRYTGVYHFAAPAIVRGRGMRETVMSGRGGVGADPKFRLSYGKGIFHVSSDILIEDIGFTDGGGGDNKSDGEACVYFENDPPLTGPAFTATIRRCAFDGGTVFRENGLFSPKVSPLDLEIDQCVFGRNGALGIPDPDGRSHDFYLGARSLKVRRTVFAGTSNANTMKVSGPLFDITDSWIGRNAGRWGDFPGGTVAKSANNIYVTKEGSPSNNAFGFYDEGDGVVNPGNAGSFISLGDTFVFSRRTEVIWVASADFEARFINAKVRWVGAPGTAPPVVEIRGPGALAGVNPFGPDAFTDANRLGEHLPAPADPVA